MSADRKRLVLAIVGWLVVFAAALLLDGPIATAVGPIAPAVKHSPITPS
jgi:hypothetical protein